eukprot:COSAG05_NODE_45_length_25418_cov_92.923299_4_plen_59_part_00
MVVVVVVTLSSRSGAAVALSHACAVRSAQAVAEAEESKCAIVWYKNLTVLIEISFGYM